jgi:suppressor for copper-sensitivity B
MVRTVAVAAILVAVCTASEPLNAASGEWLVQEGVSLRLLSSQDGLGQKQELLFGLQLRPDPGWKLFWRAPGKFGLAPTISFEESANVAKAELLWPVPQRVPVGTADEVIGYSAETVFPIRLTPKSAGSAVSLVVDLQYGICDADLCLPGDARLALTVPASGPHDAASATLIGHHLSRVPAALPPSSANAWWERGELVLQVTGLPQLIQPDVFVDAGPDRHFGRPRLVPSSGKTAVFRIPVEADVPSAALRHNGAMRAVIVSAGSAYEIEVRPAAQGPR